MQVEIRDPEGRLYALAVAVNSWELQERAELGVCRLGGAGAHGELVRIQTTADELMLLSELVAIDDEHANVVELAPRRETVYRRPELVSPQGRLGASGYDGTVHQSVLDELHEQTTAIAGRPGWRIDGQGREWYSAAWNDDNERS